jgi:general secretion pathway protein A
VAAAPWQTTAPGREDLLTSENAGWRELAPLWGLTLTESDPCAEAMRHGLQCYRQQRMTLHGLRQLNRPGVLTLRLPDGQARALVTALVTDTAILQAGERRWAMPLTALADIWRGDYATLWRTPPGTTLRINSAGNGPAREWLGTQLLALQARGLIPGEHTSYEARLTAFQHSQGIDTPGRAMPLTFMQVNLALGLDEPRLSAP